MKKRVLSLILALVMLIGVLPVNMLAAEPADTLPAQQTVTVETSLDSALADGVYAAAQSPLPVSIRAEADGEAVRYDPLLLLIAQGNGLGGGDYEAEDGSMDRVGWWACHEIAQFDEVPDGLEDVGCPFWGGLSEAE